MKMLNSTLGIAVGVLLSVSYQATSQQPPAPATQTASATPAATLSQTELMGKKVFLQRCSICHLPAPGVMHRPGLPTYGPKLEGYVTDAGSEAGARAIINVGTARMPGFQYGLTPAEIDALISYLKIAKTSEFVRPDAGVPDVVVPVPRTPSVSPGAAPLD